MKVEARLLLDRLCELASHRSAISGAELDRLKAIFLLLTSASPDALQAIDNLSYETVTKPSVDGEYSGLTIKSDGRLLSEVIADLFELDLDASNLSLDRETFQTALYAAWAIVKSFEWFSRDPVYSSEKAEALIRSTISSLNSYRETGEA